MKHLIVFTHINPKSFCAAILDARKENSMKNGNQVKVVDLYAEKFNPILSVEDIQNRNKKITSDDIKKHQELIVWADIITFIFPMWWGNAPAMLRGYFDKILSYGFAYIKDENGFVGLLNKKVEFFVTTGNTLSNLENSGVLNALRTNMEQSIINSCGMEIIKFRILDNVISISEAERKQMLNEIATL